MYPAIIPKMQTGEEAIVSTDGSIIGILHDFWQWAYSDLMGNAERGALAEYLVACALGVENSPRIAWDKFDLQTTDGIAVEVKTSGYLQTWTQKSLSRPIFGIQPTLGWDSVTNEYDKEKHRQADIYVFCLHKHTEQETADPLQLSQWDFYLLPTAVINQTFGTQKSASLSALIQAGAERCPYERLRQRISEIFSHNSHISP